MYRRSTMLAVVVLTLAILGGCVPKRKSTPLSSPSLTSAQQDSIASANAKHAVIEQARAAYANAAVKDVWHALDQGSWTSRADAIDRAQLLLDEMDKANVNIEVDKIATWSEVGLSTKGTDVLYFGTERRCVQNLLDILVMEQSKRPKQYASTNAITDKLAELVGEPGDWKTFSDLGISQAKVRESVLNHLRHEVSAVRQELEDRTTSRPLVVARLESLEEEVRWADSAFKIAAVEIGMSKMELLLVLNPRVVYQGGGTDFEMI